jgi:hypothetical protein
MPWKEITNGTNRIPNWSIQTVAGRSIRVSTNSRLWLSGSRARQPTADHFASNANEEIIEKRHAEKDLNDSAYSAFKKIIAQAREGDWKGAELESLKFQRAQRPTREQIKRLPTEKG